MSHIYTRYRTISRLRKGPHAHTQRAHRYVHHPLIVATGLSKQANQRTRRTRSYTTKGENKMSDDTKEITLEEMVEILNAIIDTTTIHWGEPDETSELNTFYSGVEN